MLLDDSGGTALLPVGDAAAVQLVLQDEDAILQLLDLANVTRVLGAQVGHGPLDLDRTAGGPGVPTWRTRRTPPPAPGSPDPAGASVRARNVC